MQSELLAHSGRKRQGIAPQTYRAHIEAVRELAMRNAEAALHYGTSPAPDLPAAVDWASCFHDLGKLLPENQRILETKESGGLAINHVDPGVAQLFKEGQYEAALLAYCHHIGLCNLPEENAKHQRSRREPAMAPFRDEQIKLQTDAALEEMLAKHRLAMGADPEAGPGGSLHLGGLTRRLLLSCLVDADHSDTAAHYQDEPDRQPAQPRWVERLESLDQYVRELGSGKDDARNALRSRIYKACRSASADEPLWACDSPVGTGKTTAVMAYLLKSAAALGLRHLFIVLPYTNIVNQSVDTYRKALVLRGEDPEKVVAAHHHQAEFRTPDLRYLTTLWDAPIIVTTAVQFFETLGANQTARLRKLHQLPGSAVFIDEAHAAMPIHLWPFMLDQITSLAKEWRCRFVLGSGTLAKFWENPRIVEKRVEIPAMVPDDLHAASSVYEKSRVVYRSRPGTLTLSELADWVEALAGPRLVVMNTVQSAAVLALELRTRGIVTKHLSTALAPVHRNPIIKEVVSVLDDQPDLNWVLVATSCVEAGLNFSFANALRERCRASSLVQIGGRVNRNGERGGGEVWDFTVNDPLLTQHPAFRHGRDVVELLFQKNMWSEELTTLMTYALGEEFKRCSGEEKIAELNMKERIGAYPDVAKLTRLIEDDTRLVVIDPQISAAIDAGQHVERKVLVSHSVQLWVSKIKRLELPQIGSGEEIYAWGYEYDAEFLGIMKGVLKLAKIDRDGCAII